jgi:NADH-quinone oxidoreductase subunit J
MTLTEAVFYFFALAAVVSAAMCVLSRSPVSALIWLVQAMLALGAIFVLLQAQFIGIIQILVYAGAIMVLFLFIIMMLRVERKAEHRFSLGQWLPAAILGLMFLVLVGLLVFTDPGAGAGLIAATVSPRAFGRFLFQRYWLAVEIVSFLLLIVLIGALFLGGAPGRRPTGGTEGDS